MKSIAGIINLTTWLALLLAIGTARAQSPPAGHEYIVRVAASLPDGTTYYGTGTVLENTLTDDVVLTCSHIFDDGGQVTVIAEGRPYPGKVIKRDASHDLAAVQCRLPEHIRGVYLADDPPAIQQRVMAAGFGGGEFYAYSGNVKGFFTAKDGNDDGRWFALTGQARSGDSGGPIVVETPEGGKLIGVLWGASSRDNETVGCHVGPIRRFLQGICNGPICQPQQPPGKRYVRPSPRPQLPPPDPRPQPVDTDAIADAIYGRMLADADKFRGERGKQGERGPAGPPGPPGEPATLDYDAIAGEVEKRLPPITVRVMNDGGEIIGVPATVGLGGTLTLHHNIVRE